jgi:deoxyribose-phosphate aldolase
MAEAKAVLARISELTPLQIASICDHTFLTRPEVARQEGLDSNAKYKSDFENFMQDMINSKLIPYAVCVRPEDVVHVRKLLKKHGKESIIIASVVGYPHGSWYTTDFKVAEAKLAIKHGANEIDMVLDCERLKKEFRKNKFNHVKKDVSAVVKACHNKKALLKLILETSLLTNDEVIAACKLADELGADFVKTSTGYVLAGAKAGHLKLMRANFSRGIKMSGWVNKDNVAELLAAASGRDDGMIELDPLQIRIGESGLLKSFNGSY